MRLGQMRLGQMRYLFFLLISIVLCGCFHDAKKETVQIMPKYHVFHRRFSSAGIACLNGLPFEKDLTYADKLILDDNLQIALNDQNLRVWNGKASAGIVEVKKLDPINNFECCEFTIKLLLLDRKYIITNKACKIKTNDNCEGFWVLADTIENYFENK